MRSYVLIDAPRKSAGKIAAELRKIQKVVVADAVNGPYPVIACIEAENPAAMAQVILFDVRNIDGVKDLTVYLSTDGKDNIPADDIFTAGILPDFSENAVGNTVSRKRKRIRKSDDE